MSDCDPFRQASSAWDITSHSRDASLVARQAGIPLARMERMNISNSAEVVSRQLDRGDCRIGDWVRGKDVPEWIDEGGPRRYTPGSVVISPEAGAIGGIVPAQHPVQWVFSPVQIEGELAWRRES